MSELLEVIQLARRSVCSRYQRQLELSLRDLTHDLHVKQFEDTEDKLTEALTTYFADDIDGVVRKLQGTSLSGSASSIAKGLLNVEQSYKEMVNLTLPVLTRASCEAALAYFASLGVDLTKASTASEWLEAMGDSLPPGMITEMPEWLIEAISAAIYDTFEQDYWQQIPVTTRDSIEGVLETGLAEGWSIQRITEEIHKRYPEEYSKNRARLVARTESGNALNGARELAYREMKNELPEDLSQSIKKEWLSVLADTTRDTHARADGQRADENELFTLAGYKIPWPAHYSLPAGERCNCMCTITTAFGVGAPDPAELEDLLT